MSKIKEKQLAKRKFIIEKATNLMNEVGFEGLTIRMICDVSGISAGTFYHYFENKSDLIIELFALIDDYFEENVLDRLNSEDELKNIIIFCKGFVEYVTMVGVERSKLINSMFPAYSKERQDEETERVVYRELHKIIIRGQEKGQITYKYSSRRLVDMILVMIRGYTFDWGRREGSYDLVENTEQMISLFVKSLKANEQIKF
ncbi:MAG: TetR/AcrR family transcriptional regulator [Senegalia sp. (in: firmicutes)]|uniref:TetR/AcrR family transcriptional regulator n=1 Tax=Senegalia sp. (in: firmicutes) TaxID=1924098 RepID=UPI003F94A291